MTEKRIGRMVSGLFAVLIMISGLGFSAVPARAAEAPEVGDVEQYYLYNFDYDTVILHSDYADKNAKEYQFFPASTVKLMTGLIVCEELSHRLSETINITSRMLDNVKGNNMALQVGEKVRVEDMIYGLLTNCANDAAQVLAVYVAGSVEQFVARMNDRAKELGMYNTVYTNPTGMHDDKMVTTLRDTVLLAKACCANELVMTATSEIKHVVSQTNKTSYRNLYNRNCMISTFYNSSSVDYRYTGLRGLNAGYTPQAGYCVITTATRNNLTYLCVVMGGKENKDHVITSYQTARTLFDWAFENYARRDVLKAGTIVTEIPVALSSTVDYVQLKANLKDADALTCYLPVDVDTKTEITYSWFTYEEELQAPVKKDTVVGAVTVLYQDQVIGTAELVTSSDITRSDFLYFLSKIEYFTTTKFFIVTIISFVVLFVVYLIIEATKEERSAKRKYTTATPVSISISPNIRRRPTGNAQKRAGSFMPSDGGSRSRTTVRKTGGSDQHIPPVNPSRRR